MPPPLAGRFSDRESLWSVSAKRLPYYLLVFAVLVTVASVAAVATASGPFWEAVFSTAERIAAFCAAALGLMVTIEGLIMGLTKILFERARERAKEEGMQEGIRQGIQQGVQQERDRLRRSGITIPPDDQSTEPNTESARKP